MIEENTKDEIILKFDGLYIMDIYANWVTISESDNITRPYNVNRHSIEMKDTILYDISAESLLNVLDRSFDYDSPIPEVATVVLSKLYQDHDGKVKHKHKIKQLYYAPRKLEKL